MHVGHVHNAMLTEMSDWTENAVHWDAASEKEIIFMSNINPLFHPCSHQFHFVKPSAHFPLQPLNLKYQNCLQNGEQGCHHHRFQLRHRRRDRKILCGKRVEEHCAHRKEVSEEDDFVKKITKSFYRPLCAVSTACANILTMLLCWLNLDSFMVAKQYFVRQSSCFSFQILFFKRFFLTF